MQEPEKSDSGAALAAGEAALAAGDPETAARHLERAAALGVVEQLVPSLARALGKAYANTDRHRDTLAWLEQILTKPHSESTHAVLLEVRIRSLRQIDTHAVIDLADEALAAAEAAGDWGAYASVLANAAFASYRRGDVRAADRFAALAKARSFPTPRSAIDALRARMFAATVGEAHEASLDFSREIRDRLLATEDLAAAANEGNNIAEGHLRLGRPQPAREEAERSAELARRSGHRPVEQFSHALIGQALAEGGDIDMGLFRLRQVRVQKNPIFAADLATLLSYYLVERRAGGDAREAAEITAAAVEKAAGAGVRHCLTSLLATRARALALDGNSAGAREALALARSAAYAADAASEQHLALAMAEVLPAGDPARSVSLNAARARLLRSAGRRADAQAYCAGVRLHRRILELTGGVPEDLPPSL